MYGIEFIETMVFTKQIKQLATDEELFTLQNELIAYPDKGDLIVGTAGLRKIRMSVGNKGKRSSARVIYYLVLPNTIYLLLAYTKQVRSSLTADEKKQLKQLAVSLKKGYNNEPI